MAHMPRQPEPEVMVDALEAGAYGAADFSEVNAAFVERLVELAGNCPAARAVDLGTGPADIPIWVVRAMAGWRVVAVDASPAMIELARRAVTAADLGESIELVLADAKNTGLPGHSFDVVFSNSILHHINDSAALWREVRRLAAPGALVFLRDLARPPDPEAAWEIVDAYAGDESDLLREEYYRSLLAAYTPDEVRGQLDATGLAPLRVDMATDRHLDVFGRFP